MLDAVRAEALKLHRHRATWMMVWIYPVVMTLLVIGVLIYGALAKQGVAAPPPSAAEWIHNGTLLWQVPRSAPGRFLLAGFVALMFAGEYGWNTWKLIIPARARWQLIAAKWLVALAFIVVALVAADIIALLGDWIGSLMGDKIPAGVTFGAVLKAHADALAYSLFPIVFTIAVAGLFAILTQSILATVILSIALVVFEGLLPLLAFFAYSRAPGLTQWLVEVLPFYHMTNLMTWARGNGVGLDLMLSPTVKVSLSWATSFWALTAWIVAAGAATQARFLRQDLN